MQMHFFQICLKKETLKKAILKLKNKEIFSKITKEVIFLKSLGETSHLCRKTV